MTSWIAYLAYIVGALALLAGAIGVIRWLWTSFRPSAARGTLKLVPLNPGREKPLADVVFVHGLGGDHRHTWKSESDASWPHMLADANVPISVWTLDYDASPTTWKNPGMPLARRATNVLALLHAHGLGQRPLFFIAHSLGGLIVKKLLQQSLTEIAPEFRAIGDATRGVIFVGTPHNGTQLATLVSGLSALGPTVTVQELRTHEPQLEELDAWYRNVAPGRFNTIAFQEGRQTKGLWVARDADPRVAGVTVVVTDHDHLTICKPMSPEDLVFVRSLKAITDASVAKPSLQANVVVEQPNLTISAFSRRDLRDFYQFGVTVSNTGAYAREAFIELQRLELNDKEYPPIGIEGRRFATSGTSEPTIDIPADETREFSVVISKRQFQSTVLTLTKDYKGQDWAFQAKTIRLLLGVGADAGYRGKSRTVQLVRDTVDPHVFVPSMIEPNDAPRASGSAPEPEGPPSLAIEYVEGDAPFLMERRGQKRLIESTEITYTQRTFRIRVRNASLNKSVKGAKVMLTQVLGVEARHTSILPDHHLRVMETNLGEGDIHPGSFVCFDVVVHELDDHNLQAIDDLSFCYAVGNMPSLPTDPGRWWEFTLRAQAIDTPVVEGRFRLSIDENNVARLKQVPPAPTTGVEASFEAHPPFVADDYVDSEYGKGGHVFRVGLRSRDEHTHVVRAYIDALEGGIEGEYLDRLMRIKDVDGGVANVPPDSKACVFVEVLKYPTMRGGSPTLLYDKKPAFGDTVKLRRPFSIRLKIVGSPKTEYITLFFVPDILGLPHVVKYELG